MNFMAKSSSSQGGFNGEDHQKQQLMSSTSPRGKLPFSSTSTSSSSSSSSQQQQQHRKNLLPPTFHHYHHHQQQQQHNITSWLEQPHQTLLTEEITGGGGGIRCYNGVPTKLDLMDASPSAGAGAGAGNEDNNDVRGGDSSSDGLGLGVGNNSGNNNTPSSASASIVGVVEREHMFDKVVTPSDVGKLNRLVIPKQHAEKYFPLDSSTNEKGLLLNFEDRNGKPWRFRYSYWNSSQSYVMTKGWSRFVKEKKLDAGDVVSFQRGVGELGKDRLFIDWRRRPDHATDNLPPSHHHHHPHPPHNYFSFHRPTTQFSWSPLFLQQQQQQQQQPPPPQDASREHYSNYQQLNATNYQPHSTSYGYGYGYSTAGGPYYSYNNNNNTSVMNPCSSSLVYVRSGGAAATHPQYQQGAAGMVQLQSSGGGGGGDEGGGSSGGSMMPSMVYESVPVVQGKAAAKRLRLFGVNMDCPISESDECDILSSSTTILPQYPTIPPHLSSSPIPPLQLRLYNGTPLPAMQHLHHKTQHQGTNNNNKSFDLDI